MAVLVDPAHCQRSDPAADGRHPLLELNTGALGRFAVVLRRIDGVISSDDVVAGLDQNKWPRFAADEVEEEAHIVLDRRVGQSERLALVHLVNSGRRTVEPMGRIGTVEDEGALLPVITFELELEQAMVGVEGELRRAGADE